MSGSKANFNYLENVNPSNYFYLHNGIVVKNIVELASVLMHVEDSVFRHHANSEKNDFAFWIKTTIGDDFLSNVVKNVFDKSQFLFLLNRRIEELKVNFSENKNLHAEFTEFLDNPGQEILFDAPPEGDILGFEEDVLRNGISMAEASAETKEPANDAPPDAGFDAPPDDAPQVDSSPPAEAPPQSPAIQDKAQQDAQPQAAPITSEENKAPVQPQGEQAKAAPQAEEKPIVQEPPKENLKKDAEAEKKSEDILQVANPPSAAEAEKKEEQKAGTNQNEEKPKEPEFSEKKKEEKTKEMPKEPMDNKTKDIAQEKKNEKASLSLDKEPEALLKKSAVFNDGGTIEIRDIVTIPIGLPEIDSLFNGGIPKRCNVLFVGMMSTGKTISALEIILNNARLGKKTLYLSFHDSEEKIINIMRRIDPSVLNYINSGNVEIKNINPFEIARNNKSLEPGSGSVNESLGFVQDTKPAIVVVDSLSTLEMSFPDDKLSYRQYVSNMFKYFEKLSLIGIFIKELVREEDIHKEFFENILSDIILSFVSTKNKKLDIKVVKTFPYPMGAKKEPFSFLKKGKKK